MTTKDTTYGLPDIGCLLGIAYQSEVAKLSKALNEAKINVTAAEYLILRVLFKHDDMQQCDISRILVKDKASISRSIQSLVKKGYVTATPVSYKCSMVSLTPQAVSLKPRLMEIATHLHKELSEKITKEQMQNLRDILETLIN